MTRNPFRRSDAAAIQMGPSESVGAVTVSSLEEVFVPAQLRRNSRILPDCMYSLPENSANPRRATGPLAFHPTRCSTLRAFVPRKNP